MTLLNSEPSLKQFLDADWERLQLKLLKYTLFRTKQLHWKTAEGLPKGKLPEDMVMDAIRKTLAGLKTEERGPGLRKWDPERCDLVTFLMGVIDSDLDELVNSKEHRSFIYGHDDDDGASAPTEKWDQNPQARVGFEITTVDAETLMIERQEVHSVERSYKALMNYLNFELADDPEGREVLKAYETLSHQNDEILPQKIEELTGFDRMTVKNAKRRIERLTMKYQKTNLPKEKRR